MSPDNTDMNPRRSEMVSRFTDVGMVLKIFDPHLSQGGGESVTIEVGDDEESYYVMLTGKTMQLIQDGKVKVGDRVVVEGRIRKDKRFVTEAPKQVVLKYASFVSVLA